MQRTAILLILAAFCTSHLADAKPKRPRSPRFEREQAPNDGTVSGVVSCYKPCGARERNCNVRVEGTDQVAKPELCPGMKPLSHPFQKATSEESMYVVAASGKFRRQVGLGAKVRIPGIKGIGVVCDVCPGCDKHGKILDLASEKNSDRNNCTSAPRGTLKIEVVKAQTSAGKR